MTFVFVLMVVKIINTICLTITRILFNEFKIFDISTIGQIETIYILRMHKNLFYIINTIFQLYDTILVLISMVVIITPSGTIMSTKERKIIQRLLIMNNISTQQL